MGTERRPWPRTNWKGKELFLLRRRTSDHVEQNTVSMHDLVQPDPRAHVSHPGPRHRIQLLT